MATKEAPKAEESTEAAPPKRGKKLIIIAASAVLTLLLILGGVGFAAYKMGRGAAAHTDQAGEETADAKDEKSDAKKEEKKDEPKKPPVFIAVDPFTVNLQPETSNGGDQFLQMVVTLRVADEKKGEELKAYMPQIRHEILNLAGSKKASEITSPDGREDLADDIKDVVNEVLGYEPPKKNRRKKSEKEEPVEEPPVMSVFFTQFIVQ